MKKLSITTTVVPAMLLFLLFVGYPNEATAKKRDRSTTFEVPTSGKIMDVVYYPEFDEWWVKCREGERICVYTYDPRMKEWGKVQFVPKKPDDRGKDAEKTGSNTDTDANQDKALPPKADEMKPEPAKSSEKTDQRKWWDPFKILKSGEKLIFPSSPEKTK